MDIIDAGAGRYCSNLVVVFIQCRFLRSAHEVPSHYLFQSHFISLISVAVFSVSTVFTVVASVVEVREDTAESSTVLSYDDFAWLTVREHWAIPSQVTDAAP